MGNTESGNINREIQKKHIIRNNRNYAPDNRCMHITQKRERCKNNKMIRCNYCRVHR